MFPGVWGLSGDFCIIDVFEGVPDGFLAVPGGFIICCHGYPCIPVPQIQYQNNQEAYPINRTYILPSLFPFASYLYPSAICLFT